MQLSGLIVYRFKLSFVLCHDIFICFDKYKKGAGK